MQFPELQVALGQSTQDVLAMIARAPDDRLFAKADEKQWSLAEVVEHLILLEFALVRVLQGTSLPPTRAYDAEVAALEDALGDTSRALHAPPPIAPTGRYKDRVKLVEAFVGVRRKLSDWMQDHDAKLLYPDFRHALFGELTGYEWLRFTVAHTQRHLQQMQRALA